MAAPYPPPGSRRGILSGQTVILEGADQPASLPTGPSDVRFGSRVDGPLQDFLTFCSIGRVRSCVRPVGAAGVADLAALVEPLLIVRRALREQIVILHRRLLAIVRDDEVCRRLMTTPGVGPVVALTYRATVDVPARFRKSKSVGAVFGLTCSKYQSGEI